MMEATCPGLLSGWGNIYPDGGRESNSAVVALTEQAQIGVGPYTAHAGEWGVAPSSLLKFFICERE